MTDTVLSAMAAEVKEVLESKGLDPANPPTSVKPPSSAVFAEYRRRGGTEFTDADKLADALVTEVKKQAA